jgi:hypothetical protein
MIRVIRSRRKRKTGQYTTRLRHMRSIQKFFISVGGEGWKGFLGGEITISQRYISGPRAGRSGFWGSIPRGGWEFFSSQLRPERFRSPLSLLSNGYQGLFPWGKAAGMWNRPLTSIKCRGQRMSGAIPSLPQYAFLAWCSVKAEGQLCL